MDLSINNYTNRNVRPNFRARLIVDSAVTKNSNYFKKVAKEFQNMTSIDEPNGFYLLKPQHGKFGAHGLPKLTLTKLVDQDSDFYWCVDFNNYFNDYSLDVENHKEAWEVARVLCKARNIINDYIKITQNYADFMTKNKDASEAVLHNKQVETKKAFADIISEHTENEPINYIEGFSMREL